MPMDQTRSGADESSSMVIPLMQTLAQELGVKVVQLARVALVVSVVESVAGSEGTAGTAEGTISGSICVTASSFRSRFQ